MGAHCSLILVKGQWYLVCACEGALRPSEGSHLPAGGMTRETDLKLGTVLQGSNALDKLYSTGSSLGWMDGWQKENADSLGSLQSCLD